MDPKNLPGSIKVAILIQSAGKVASERILSMMNEEERRVIENHLAQMGEISPDVVEKVSQEFLQLTGKTEPRRIGGPPLPQETETTEERSGGSDRESSDLSVLKSLKADRLLELIKDEHPQTIAVILVHVKSDVASNVLSNLPDETKAEVGHRIATLDRVGSGMVQEVARIFDDVIRDSENSMSSVKGGVDKAADILNLMDGMSSQIILETIEEDDVDLAASIKQKMFSFEDVVLVDNQGLQKVLRKVESRELAMALKAASDDVKEKIFSNISERAAEMLKEEIEILGAVRMKDVEDAQYLVTRTIQDMADQGEIVIAGRGGEQLIV
ncbi:MAG: flagellar motor switch protein FliG [Deltaproteobacteria bacterium]|nr:flagellar motor switch protein FliG [Deltaproteobacteria bacterium]